MGDELVEGIADTIEAYASAYRRLEKLQHSNPPQLPPGDQKTGVIAEYFALMYAREKFRPALVNLAGSNMPWDISVRGASNSETKIQVKGVSIHSTTRRISPIQPGWDELWLMCLDEAFLPDSLWVVEASSSPWSVQTQLNKTMPRRGISRGGSRIFSSGTDEFSPLANVVMAAHPHWRSVIGPKLTQSAPALSPI